MEPFAFKRSTYALIAAILVLFGVFFTLKAVRERQEPRKRAAAEVTMWLEPAAPQVNVDDEVTFNVMVDTTSTYNLIQADIHLTFDPAYFSPVSISNGSFLPNILDAGGVTSGTAYISLGSSLTQPAQGQGVLTVLTLKAIAPVGATNVVVADTTYLTSLQLGSGTNILSSRLPAVVTISTVNPTPTPSPSPTATPDPTPSASPDPTPTPEASPSDQPAATPTPTATPLACSATTPSAPAGLAATATSTSTVNLTWGAVSPVTRYGVVYGLVPGQYLYGADDIGNTTAFTVSALSANTTYYFAVYGVNDCARSSYSNEALARTTSGVGGGTLPSPHVSPSSYTYAQPSPTFYPLAQASPGDLADNPFLDESQPAASELPPVSVPPDFGKTKITVNPLLTPIGGVLIIIVTLFVGILFFRLRR